MNEGNEDHGKQGKTPGPVMTGHGTVINPEDKKDKEESK